MSRRAFHERIENAGLADDRYVSVKDGEKACVDHDTRYSEIPDGNCGVYADPTDKLVILDIDDYTDGVDTDGLAALAKLPPTLEVSTPHGGTHRFFKASVSDDGRYPSAVFKDRFETQGGNLKPSWGEVRVNQQYVVGVGSQLDGCDKDWCDECAKPEGGKYELQSDQEIATVDVKTLVEVLESDSKLQEEDEDNGNVSEEIDTADVDDILEYALEESNDEKLKRLWRGDYSDYGGDRSEAESALAYKLAFWLRGDKRAVRDAMDRADTKKWSERDDESYRESVLTAVDKCDTYYDPEKDTPRETAPTYDEEEAKRGEKILRSECTRTEPAGELEEINGHYGYRKELKNEEGEVYREVFNEATNFTLETLEHLETDSGELLRVRVHPAHPMEEHYDVSIHPTVFNEARSFKEEVVRGKTTRFEPPKNVQTVLNDLRETVGSQMVPVRTGVEHIGLVGEEYDEWVSPKGTITADGEAEDPDHRYYAKGGNGDSEGGALARKWDIEPETVPDYDSEQVAEFLSLLPETRKLDRGLPILGWFYAAPLRPIIHDIEGEFNLLQVIGGTGSGKTSTLKMYWEAFGMDPDPFSASDTPFTLMKHMSSSSGIPVWIDEYKPADIRNDRLDRLHRRLREVTKGTTVSKGRANLDEVMFHIKSPVVVSGEQQFSNSVPAVRRRAIMTSLSEAPTRDGTSFEKAFCEITGTPYENGDGPQYPEGLDLYDHARAYYKFILGLDAEAVEEWWREARTETVEILTESGLSLDASEFQGAQTIVFGVRLYEKFGKSLPAEENIEIQQADIERAIEHIASNIGQDGQRLGYDDSFLELFAQAVAAGYVDQGKDYRFIDSSKWNREVLAFHMPSVDAAVRKYVREYNLEDEYTLVGKTDYLSAFSDKIERDGSHVLDVNRVANLDGGRVKCVYIDPAKTNELLGSAFDLRGFGKAEEEEAVATPISALSDTSDRYATVTVNVAVWEETSDEVVEKNGPVMSGTLKDSTGAVDAVAFKEPSFTMEEGETYRLTDVRIGNYDGSPQVEIVKGLTEAETVQHGVGYTGSKMPNSNSQQDLKSSTATDGGSQLTIPDDATDIGADAKRIRSVVKSAGTSLSRSDVVVELTARRDEMDPNRAEKALEKAKREGLVIVEDDEVRIN